MAEYNIRFHRPWDDRPTTTSKEIWRKPSFLDCQVVFYGRKKRIIPMSELFSILFCIPNSNNEISRMYATPIESKCCIFNGMFILEGDENCLDAGRLKPIGMYWYNGTDTMPDDQIIGYGRCEIESCSNADLNENRVTCDANLSLSLKISATPYSHTYPLWRRGHR